MKKLLLILLCLPMIGFGQGWIKTYSNPTSTFFFGGNVQQTTDSGFVIFGANVIKTNVLGDTVWTSPIFTSDGVQTIDGGYISISPVGPPNLISGMIKLDEFGDTLWTKPFKGNNIIQTSDKGFVFSYSGGYAFNKNISHTKSWDCLFIYKTDSLGDTLWSNHPLHVNPLAFESSANSIQETDDGGFIIAGWKIPQTLSRLLLLKTDAVGDSLWTLTLGSGSNYVRGGSARQTTDGGYIAVGCRRDTSNNPNQCTDILLIKTDSLGNTFWTKTFDKGCENCIGAIEQTTDGGYILAGTADYDVWLIKTDAIGDTLWTATFGTINYDCGLSVKQTIDGGYIILGSWNNDSTVLIKTNSLGTLTSINYLHPNNITKGNLIQITDILGRETKRKKNVPLFYIYDDGTVEKKIIIE